jgi:hypothetical protein
VRTFNLAILTKRFHAEHAALSESSQLLRGP